MAYGFVAAFKRPDEAMGRACDVRFWHKADMAMRVANVAFGVTTDINI